MFREYEIEKQASLYTDDADNYLEYSDDRGWTDKNDKEFVKKAFIEGANWADSNPISPWISTEISVPHNYEDLTDPDNKRYSKYVIGMANGHAFLTRTCQIPNQWHSGGCWYWEGQEPTYWMRLPEITENGRIRPL